MGIKLGKVVTYFEGPPPIKSLNPLSTWSNEIELEIKNVFYCNASTIRPLYYLYFGAIVELNWLCEVTWQIENMKSYLS